ncbi:MAG TPA: hypothetical protein VGM32_14320, partial [Rhodopila sp.]
MIAVAVWIVTFAVAAGTGLALWHLHHIDGAPRPPHVAGIAHGVVGTIGLGILVLALRGPARGVAAGVGSFGTIAAILFAGALLTGMIMLVFRRKTIVMAI